METHNKKRYETSLKSFNLTTWKKVNQIP